MTNIIPYFLNILCKQFDENYNPLGLPHLNICLLIYTSIFKNTNNRGRFRLIIYKYLIIKKIKVGVNFFV